jgi:RHS repeat-associated protein
VSIAGTTVDSTTLAGQHASTISGHASAARDAASHGDSLTAQQEAAGADASFTEFTAAAGTADTQLTPAADVTASAAKIIQGAVELLAHGAAVDTAVTARQRWEEAQQLEQSAPGSHEAQDAARRALKAAADARQAHIDIQARKLPGRGNPSPAGDSAPDVRPPAGREPPAAQGPREKPTAGDPVDVATGDVIMHQVDAQLPGVLPLLLERAYCSSYPAGRWFGPGWASTLDQRLVADDAGVVLLTADGRRLCYPHPPAGGGEVLPVAGPRWPLRRDSTGYVVTDPEDGRTSVFTTNCVAGEFLLDRITDRNGNQITFSYGAGGVPEYVDHSGGYRINVSITSGWVSALALAGAGADGGDVPLVRFEYADGHLAQVVNSSGQPLEFSYDDKGRMTGWQDRNSCWYRYSYGAQGRCVEGTGAGGTMSVAFHYEPRRTTVTSADGAVTVFDLDEHGLVAAETSPGGGVTRYQRNASGQVIARTDPLGRLTRHEYGGHGLLTDLTRPDGSRLHIDYAQHANAHLPSQITDPDGGTWSYDRDVRGNLTKVTGPDGTSTSYSYSERGSLTTVTSQGGAVTRITADPAGLPLTVTAPDGTVTAAERDGFGQVTTVTGPSGEVTRYGRTTEGKLAFVIWPDGAREDAAYDAEGNLIRHTGPAGQVTTFSYTCFDLPVTFIAPDGSTWRYAYDRELRLTEVTNPAGLIWRYEYDPDGRLAAETDFNRRSVRYGYDPAGQLTSTAYGAGQQTRYWYDELGKLIRRDADGQVTTFSYDRLGRMTGARNADADLVINRDPLGRVLSETINGAAMTYCYDKAGRRTSRTTPSGAVTRWDWNPIGRPVTLTTGGHQIAFGYDHAGREITRRIGTGVTLTQEWDPSGRLTAQILARAGVPGTPALETTLPDVGPRPTTLPAPGAGVGVLQQRRYQWAPGGLLDRVDDELTGPRAFQHDVLGRITTVTGPAWQEIYNYDATGNIAATRWPTSAPGAHMPGLSAAPRSAPHPGTSGDQTPLADAPIGALASGRREYMGTLLRRAGAVSYRYDKEGRVISQSRKRPSRKPATWHYTWDVGDHLTAVTTPDGTSWHYVYDPLGRRIAKQQLAPDGSVACETRFSWDGPLLAEQATTNGNPGSANAPDSGSRSASAARPASANGPGGTERPDVPTRLAGVECPAPVEVLTWEYQPGTFTPVTQARRIPAADTGQDWIDAQFYAIITSNIGAPVELVTPGGDLAWQQAATIWGAPVELVTPGGDGASTPLRFPGQYYDEETGWYYNHHRYYDPATARYATPDPLGLSLGPNPHGYVINPTTQIDPLGLTACKPVNSGRDVVLGLNDGSQVVRFARDNLYGQFMETANGDPISAEIMRSMVTHAINATFFTIHVLLDGLDGTNPNPMEKYWYSVDQGYANGFKSGNYTNWEMSYLDRAVENGTRSASSVRFYVTENGKLVGCNMPDWAFGVRMSYQGGSSPYRTGDRYLDEERTTGGKPTEPG